MDMEPIEYSVRHDLLGKERTFRLETGVLSVHEGADMIASIPLERVTAVRLKYYASQHRPEYYTATVFHRGGSVLIISSSYTRLGEFGDRGEQNAEFIRAFHDELLPYAHTIRFVGGIGMQLFVLYIGIMLLSIVFLGWILFFFPAEYVTDLVWVKIALVLMLLWVGVRFMRKNKPIR